MPAIDKDAVAAQLKRTYGNIITDLYARFSMTYNQYMKTNKVPSVRPGGVGYYFSLRESDIESVGGRSPTGGTLLPEPLTADGVQGVVTPVAVYGTLRLHGLAIEAGKTNVEAFVSTQGDAIKNLFLAFVHDLNRQCHGDGFGLLGTTSADATPSTSAAWTVTFDNDRGVRYIRPGMVCDFYAPDGSIDQSASSVRVQSVDPIAKTVTFEKMVNAYRAYHPIAAAQAYNNAASTIPANSVLVRYGARDVSFATSDTPYEITGMLGMYDDGTLISAYNGVTISSHPLYKANVMDNSGVGRDVSLDLMLAAVDMTQARSGLTPNRIRMGLGQRRKYFDLLKDDVRYAPAKFVGGYEVLSFAANGAIDIVVDPVTQPNRMFFEPDGVIRKYELTPIGWGGFDPNKMHWRQGYDEAQLYLRTYTNLAVEKRQALTVISDLNEPSNLPF